MSLSSNQQRIGILLFNLGGPETLDDVRPFLYNLFSDPDIIRLPWSAIQKPLAWIISTQRYKKSRGYYEKIGGGSPLRKITHEQARALEDALGKQGINAKAYVGMRYWKPTIEEALSSIALDRVAHLIVLPLYPQFSISTTGSSINLMNSLLKGRSLQQLSVIREWHDHPGYIGALTQTVVDELSKFPNQDPTETHIVFSAHSVPVSYIEAGDPYLAQTQKTVDLVMRQLGSERPHSLSFQSKVGPVKWLRPSTDETLRRLAKEEIRQVLLVPVSFVSEHIETLYELDILYKDVANEIGLEHYRRVPALNCRPDFIDALAGLVKEQLESRTRSESDRTATSPITI
jgi:ferrochelatase